MPTNCKIRITLNSTIISPTALTSTRNDRGGEIFWESNIRSYSQCHKRSLAERGFTFLAKNLGFLVAFFNSTPAQKYLAENPNFFRKRVRKKKTAH